ncbi:ribonuclease M5 [Tepidimicrobium xylanilyticum]|uniref:Ribonuclease M5 n=1 Tax=Tepidimicrobium xylanilyticum TaxID=1123352 RepID=A0A1H2WJ33_9FIRM|nr:ribonuclease M5 [Tepidimicrobium xylanilyticum]GMG95232.1 ribonuclease M5 [Tepidimicrobium xylanilyticum]SDW80264.1 ribonuclease M5 [Tepidimicrobium xylanilyticum]
MIKEIIVVEGRDDITAVKSAIEAEVIATGGFGYDERFIENLKKIAHKRGIIILTDPDYAGERIRKHLSKHIKNCKHAFLPQGKALKEGDVGVENATKEDIIDAINKARPVIVDKREEFTKEDLLELGLIGDRDSRRKREILGNILGIGYGNSKQFLNRLNHFGITREEFVKALELMEKYE